MNVADAMPWVHAIGLSLVHFIWQGVVIGAVFAFARMTIPIAQSSFRYACGLGALLLLALCPLATLWMLRPATEAMLVSSADNTAFALSGVVIQPSAESALAAFLPWLVALWICGVAVAVARAAHQWRTLEGIATRLAYRQHDIEEILRRVALPFGGLRRVRVLISRHIDTPILIGWINPVILLPTAVVLGFPRQQLELILAHELGHLRRYDHVVNLFQAALEMVLFYHPVVHWISREVRHEREVCCDELVLRMTEREPREYARTLAALENLRQVAPQLAVAASGGHLLDRVRRIIAAQPSAGVRNRRTAWLLAAGGATVAALLMISAKVQQDEPLLAFEVPAPALASISPFAALGSVSPSEFVAFSMTRPGRVALPVLAKVDAVDVVPTASSASPMEVSVRRVADDFTANDRAASPMAAAVEPMPAMTMPASTGSNALVATPPQPKATAASNAATSAKPAIRPTPRIIRRVDPVYPDINVSGSRGYVEFEFALDDVGAVRDIKLVSGEALAGFTVAARKALRQWRFSAASARAFRGERFRQDFVFAGLSDKPFEVADSICPRETGSNLCRPGRGIGLTTEARPVGAVDDTILGEYGDAVSDAASMADDPRNRTPVDSPSSGTPDAGL